MSSVRFGAHLSDQVGSSMNRMLVGIALRCPAREAAGGIVAPLRAARTAQRAAQRAVPTGFMVPTRAQKRKGALHEPLGAPPGFGVRQSSGAFTSCLETEKSGRGLPQSKTLPRGAQGSWSQRVRKSGRGLSMNLVRMLVVEGTVEEPITTRRRVLFETRNWKARGTKPAQPKPVRAATNRSVWRGRRLAAIRLWNRARSVPCHRGR